MGYVPKPAPIIQSSNPSPISGYVDLTAVYLDLSNKLNKSGDTGTGYYYFLSGITGTTIYLSDNLSANTVNSNFYFSAGTPLELIIQQIASGITVNIFNESSGSTLLWTAGTGDNSIVANNYSSLIADSDFALVAGGGGNQIFSGSTSSIIGNGAGNIIYSQSPYCGILGGNYNSIYSLSNYSSIVGGRTNRINNSPQSFIGSGFYNQLYYSPYSSIVGGQNNLFSYARYSFLGGGEGHYSYGQYNVICGGGQNRNIGNHSFIGGGANNNITGQHQNVICGGNSNQIINSFRSSILGGAYHSILNLTGTTILGGQYITASSNNTTYAPSLVSIDLSGATTRSVGADSEGRLVIFSATGSSSYTPTYLNNGINTFTGGTLTNPTVNVTGLSLSNITVSGSASFQTLSATTYYSGSTELSTLFGSISLVNVLQNQISTKVNKSGDTMTGKLTAPSISATTLSATTYYSGNTLLSNYFGESNTASNLNSVGLFNSKVGLDLQFRGISAGTGIDITQQVSAITITYTGTSSGSGTPTYLKNGTNTFTGGTLNNPSVNVTGLTIDNINVSGNTRFVSLSATTLSGGTIYSGSTELSNLFEPKRYYYSARTTDQTLVGASHNSMGLSFPVAANEQWTFEFIVPQIFATSSGLRSQFVFPVGSQFRANQLHNTTTQVAFSNIVTLSSATETTATFNTFGQQPNGGSIRVNGWISVPSTTAGTVDFQWRNLGSATTVFAGAYVTARKIN